METLSLDRSVSITLNELIALKAAQKIAESELKHAEDALKKSEAKCNALEAELRTANKDMADVAKSVATRAMLSPTAVLPMQRSEWFRTLQIQKQDVPFKRSQVNVPKKLAKAHAELLKKKEPSEQTLVRPFFDNHFRNAFNGAFSDVSLESNDKYFIPRLKPDLVLLKLHNRVAISASPFNCFAIGEVKGGRAASFTWEEMGQALEYGANLLKVNPLRTSIFCFLVNAEHFQLFQVQRFNNYNDEVNHS
jgi:hypothetical protein